MTNVARLRQLLASATPGPWKRLVDTSTVMIDANGDAFEILARPGLRRSISDDRNDASLTVEAINALPALLDRIEDLQRQVLAQGERMGELEGALKPFAEVAEHDIGTDEADHDFFRPITRNHAPLLRVGHLRRAAALLSVKP